MEEKKKGYFKGQHVGILLFVTVIFCFPHFLLAGNVVESLDQRNQSQEEIRVVMAAAFVSEAGLSVYEEIFQYLGEKLDRKVNLISGFSYETINIILDSGKVDVGFICGLPYVIKQSEPQSSIDLLLAPVMKDAKYKDKPIYYSYVIVHKDSKFESFSDLRKSRFVFNDEISNSGYNMPRAHLIDLGETSGFFGEVVRSGSHEESIRMVALGEADVSAVDSLVYDYDRVKNPEYIQQTKVLKILGPAGIPPVIVSTKINSSLRNKIRNVFLEMKNDPAGKMILDKALVDRFTIVDDSNYNGIRTMNKQAQDSGFAVIR